MGSYGEVPKGYRMDETNPELPVLRRKKDGLGLAFFPPGRATRMAVLQTVVKDREWHKTERDNAKRRKTWARGFTTPSTPAIYES